MLSQSNHRTKRKLLRPWGVLHFNGGDQTKKRIHKSIRHELKIASIKPVWASGSLGPELFGCVTPLRPGYRLPSKVVFGHVDLGKLCDTLPI